MPQAALIGGPDVEGLGGLAHRTLPFGTKRRVTNVQTGKSVIVRVNDRGPFIAGRELDLSYSAAESLGMIEQGVSKVQMTVVQ